MTATTAAPPRFRTVSSAGTIVALILVVAFGNAAYADWVNNNTSANSNRCNAALPSSVCRSCRIKFLNSTTAKRLA